MKLAQQLALWGDQLREMSAYGLYFETNRHALERYERLQQAAIEMLALADGVTPDDLEPLRGTVISQPTPLSVADAAVFDGDGRLLLIRRADNGRWAMPGGALEVGETPAAGAAREFHEETGLRCRITGLGGVFDSRLCGTTSRHHLYQFVFLGKLLPGGEMGNGSHREEVLDVAWFDPDHLPADVDAGHQVRIPAACRVWRGERGVYFDGD